MQPRRPLSPEGCCGRRCAVPGGVLLPRGARRTGGFSSLHPSQTRRPGLSTTCSASRSGGRRLLLLAMLGAMLGCGAEPSPTRRPSGDPHVRDCAGGGRSGVAGAAVAGRRARLPGQRRLLQRLADRLGARLEIVAIPRHDLILPSLRLRACGSRRRVGSLRLRFWERRGGD